MQNRRYRIACIKTKDVQNLPYDEVITHIGIVTVEGVYELSKQQAIDYIEKSNYSFYVEQGGREVDVIVAGPVRVGDSKYLKTSADTTTVNNLLSLKKC